MERGGGKVEGKRLRGRASLGPSWGESAVVPAPPGTETHGSVLQELL